MRNYSNIISLHKNARGVYSIDPSIGCTSGTKTDKRGCFSDCYAARIAKIYGYNFSNTVYRNFKSEKHLHEIKRQIEKVKLPFIRMGTMGDPSENWEHTINIIKLLQTDNQLKLFSYKYKNIVIITKHWTNLSDTQLLELANYNITINTSVSAVDEYDTLKNAINQHNRLCKLIKSVLRLVTFDFNTENDKGIHYKQIQDNILSKYVILDTVFRASKNNHLYKDGIINVHKTKFLGKPVMVSKMNKKTYFGSCNNCIEMCGVNM